MKYPIRPGRRETLVDWIARLEGRSTELAEALAEAGLIAEAAFLERSDGSKLPLVQELNQLLTESVDIENAVPLEPIFHTP